jgi:ankyrin repeat protein
MYGPRTAAFLFARALNRTEEFRLASNVKGAGAFDDLVFRYRLRDRDDWKTCFIQLKHKKNGGTIKLCSLTQMSGDFSLFKYFESYCEITRKASTDCNLKNCGPVVDFEFIIYTNARMEGKSALQGGDTDPVSILGSKENEGNCITFDESCDRDVFEFFQELSRYKDSILELDSLIKKEKLMNNEINEKIKDLQSTFTSKAILDSLDGLQSKPSNIDKLVKEVKKCDFSLYGEFLRKVRIFQGQLSENSFETLIKEELQEACQTSPSCANSIYRKFDEALRVWWQKSGSVKWLSENSHAWQSVKQYLIEKTKQLSESEIQETVGCNLSFKQQHIEKLSDAIKQNSILNIITNTNLSILSKLKTYQTLVSLGYKNSLFINSKSLLSRRKEVLKLWPCKWSAVLVIDCEKDSHSVDDKVIDTLVGFLRRYQQRLILISPRGHGYLASRLGQELGNIYKDYEDTCNFLDLDEESQKQILGKKVDFQGTKVTLETLVGTDTQEFIKPHIDSDVLSILLSRGKNMCVGRKLGDHCKYYVQRVLEHHIYLKNDILKLTDSAITFAVSGVQADQLKKYLPAGEKICEFVYDEREKTHSFKLVADFSKPGLSAEWGTMKTRHEIGQKIKPKEVRYIILRKTHPESDFRELKALCTNLHWIHMEDGSFLWRESNCNIDIIRRYIDDAKCKKYDIKILMEHNDRTMLLVAEPGMGKSTFLSYMEHEIKKCKPAMWVLRINLHEHTRALKNIEFGKECIDKCKMFLWGAARSHEQDALMLEEIVFQQALERTGNVVILLDGFDEISPKYSRKVETLIREVTERTPSKVWVSSRSSYRLKLEDIMVKFSFTLKPFTGENQIDFLEEYWNSSIGGFKPGSLRSFAEKLLSLCSKNFNDKDGKFTGIPLQTMMLGEAFVEEAKRRCSNEKINLPNNFNLLVLFKMFTEKKFNICFDEKNAMDSSKPLIEMGKKLYLEKHMITALMSLFSINEVKRLLGARGASDVEQAEGFLYSGEAEQLGIITDITDGKPHFIHRCFAEYFAAKWFTDNFKKCENFISNTLFISTYEVTRNIFDRMIAEDSEIHNAVLNNDILAVEEFLAKKKGINCSDKGGRTALHLAASYNSPVTTELLSVSGVDVKKPDAVLKWTPLRYADRTKSWMAMDMLLQNGANTDDIVLTRRNVEDQEWGQAALWECASKGHIKLLEFMLNCGTDANAVVRVPENLHKKYTLLHRASLCGQLEVVRLLVDRSADVNIHSAHNDTALHLAALSDNIHIIELLLSQEMSVNLTNILDMTPLHVSAARGNLEATKAFVERGAVLNNTDKYGYTPLMLAAYSGKLEVVRYLTEVGANINVGSETIAAALLLAVGAEHSQVLHFLLENGADINSSNAAWDMSPLILATLRQNLPFVKYLVQRGADVNLCTTDGSALHAAAYVGNLDITDYLLEKGADLNACDADGATPLAVAMFYNQTELGLYFMEKGADVNVPDFEKATPLHHAVWNNNLKCTKHLVQLGANINYQGPENVTALSMAIELERIHIINILVENQASTNLRDALGNTALHVAAGKGNFGLVHYLIDRGADVNIPNNEGNTPLQWINSIIWNKAFNIPNNKMNTTIQWINSINWNMADHLLFARIPRYFPPLNIQRMEIVINKVEIFSEPRFLIS